MVETDILSEAITFIQLETSIGVFVSPLLGGTISDSTGDYSYVFYIAGILLLSGSLILEPIAIQGTQMALIQGAQMALTSFFSGAGCAGLVAVRRRCSFGEIVEEDDDEKRVTTDGFDPTKSNTNIQNGTSSRNITGSQVVASRSVLGINIATDPRRRSKSRTLEEQEKVSWLYLV